MGMFTKSEVEAMRDRVQGKAAVIPATRRGRGVRRKPKYSNVKTVVDGNKFDSKAEAKRYGELKQKVRAGEIRMLELQPKYPISTHTTDGKTMVKLFTYIADFRYTTKDGAIVVEDVKGFKTPLYRLKKKIVECWYGIKIIEITK